MTQARNGHAVKLRITGRKADGTVFAMSADSAPIEFVLGEGQVLPGIEAAAVGMAIGEQKTVQVSAGQAYGLRRDDLVQAVPKDCLPENLPLKVGQQLRIRQADGETLIASVTEVTEDTVTLDGNHPLAGQDLTFEIEMLEIN